MQMTIYDAATVGSRSNCVYPNPVTVTDADTMRQAAAFDHVCAAYKQNYRSVDNFLKADCLPMDCDNDHSDDPDDWLTPFDVAMDFPGVGMIFVYSRSHMKQKGKRGPRPRFHVYFICTETTNSEIYSSWKDRLIADYPYFDDGAKDSARFLFGVKNAAVEVYDGEITIDAFLADRFAEWDAAQGQIPEGSRNKTMSHYAGRIIKRLGNTEEAHKQFLKEAEKCSPPLDDAELAGIWASAVKFGAKVAAQEGYIPPEQYNQDFLLMPEDFSDVGQAIVLSREYMDRLRFSPATDYIVFNGSFWEESQPNAQGIAQELTARQLEEAETEIQRCMKEMSENGAWAMLAAMGAKKAMAAFSEAQRRSFEKYERAETYRKYAIKRRDTKYISAALKEARPMIQIEQRVLDADEFLLNLPSGTCDLRTGAVREHNAQDYITKQTAVDPSGDGMDVWEDALQTFFQGDTDLIRYVQEIVGLAAIGKVYIEALVIAYGEGRNGKSTFWNTIARVLGTYSGNMSADTLTVGCKFCAIAEGVKFIMNGANHRMDGITTYPFNIFGCGWEKVTPTIEQLPIKGDTVIGNDVWIGQNVTIMPGVIIGDGAIIATNSTVVKSVEPYSIYGGNPAKFIKKRFSDEKIEFLLKLEWWNWSGEEIFDNLEILTSEAGLEELMNKYSKRDAIN